MERQSHHLRESEIGRGKRYRERAGGAERPCSDPPDPDRALPTSSRVVPVTLPALLSPHHSGWATVKRRCRRMLWFTRSFLKSPGEPRGESLGESGPGVGVGAVGTCITATA